MGSFIVDFEIIDFDLTSVDVSLKVNFVIGELCRRAARQFIVKFVVVFVRTLEFDIFIANNLVIPSVNLRVAGSVHIRWIGDVFQCDIIFISGIRIRFDIGRDGIAVNHQRKGFIDRSIRRRVHPCRIHSIRAVIDLARSVLYNIENQRGLCYTGPAFYAGIRREIKAADVIVVFIRAGKGYAARKSDRLVVSNRFVVECRCEITRGSDCDLPRRVRIIQILIGKTGCLEAASGQRLLKRLRYIFRSVIHAGDNEAGVLHINLAFINGHVDAAQVRAVLIRPKHGFCTRVADVFVTVKRCRACILIREYQILLSAREGLIIAHIIFAADVAVAVNNLDDLAVIGQLPCRDVCTIV